MNNIKDKILSQTKAVNWWGRFRYVAQFVSFYFLILTAITASGTFFYTVIKPWLKMTFDIDLGIFLFYGILGVGLVIVLLFEYKVTMPGWQATWNQQWWRHDNPMRQKFEANDEKQEKIEKDLKLIKKALNIKEDNGK